MKNCFGLATCFLLFGCCSVTVGQDANPTEVPRFGEFGGVIDLQSSFSTGRSISVQDINGVRTTQIQDDEVRMKIVEDPAAGISCELTQHYGPGDMDALEQDHPELYMHLAAIPKTVEEATIEIGVDVTKTYTASDEDDLAEQHPDVFLLYEKYTKNSSPGSEFRFDSAPMRIRISPRGQPEIEFEQSEDSATDDDSASESSESTDDNDG